MIICNSNPALTIKPAVWLDNKKHHREYSDSIILRIGYMTVSGNDHRDSAPYQHSPALAFYGKMLTFSRLQFSTDDLGADAQLAKRLSNKSSNIPSLSIARLNKISQHLVVFYGHGVLQPIGVITGHTRFAKPVSSDWLYFPPTANVLSVFYLAIKAAILTWWVKYDKT